MADIEKIANADITPAGQVGSIKDESLPLKVVGDLKDIAADLFQQSLQYDPEQLKADAKKVKKKLDFIVLPMVWHSHNYKLEVILLTGELDDDDIYAELFG
jgi:hypothetical protein